MRPARFGSRHMVERIVSGEAWIDIDHLPLPSIVEAIDTPDARVACDGAQRHRQRSRQARIDGDRLITFPRPHGLDLADQVRCILALEVIDDIDAVFPADNALLDQHPLTGIEPSDDSFRE